MVKPVQESDYPEIMDNQIKTFWQHRKEGLLKGKLGKNLFWLSLTSPEHTKAIVLVNGRVESSLKYQELFYHFYHLGYDIYSYDHRGQGMSDRLGEDRQVGHVECFDYYVDDLATLVDSFALSRYKKRYMIAHSMGGAVATRYMQSHPNHGFDALALSAPMFGVNLSPLLLRIAPYWSGFIAYLSSKPSYFTKNREYNAKPFKDNSLTSSAVRYRWFRDLYEEMPQLKLGGPSARWVWQALLAAKACKKNVHEIDLPIVLLQASDDVIVRNVDQTSFMESLSPISQSSKLETFPGCKHEVLFETDSIRNRALQITDDFFNRF